MRGTWLPLLLWRVVEVFPLYEFAVDFLIPVPTDLAIVRTSGGVTVSCALSSPRSWLADGKVSSLLEGWKLEHLSFLIHSIH